MKKYTKIEANKYANEVSKTIHFIERSKSFNFHRFSKTTTPEQARIIETIIAGILNAISYTYYFDEKQQKITLSVIYDMFSDIIYKFEDKILDKNNENNVRIDVYSTIILPVEKFANITYAFE